MNIGRVLKVYFFWNKKFLKVALLFCGQIVQSSKMEDESMYLNYLNNIAKITDLQLVTDQTAYEKASDIPILILAIVSSSVFVLCSYNWGWTLRYPNVSFGSVVSNKVASCAALLISKQYVLAMGFAMLEHLTEMLIFPEIKEYWFISNIGLLMVLIGEILRKLAVVTAGRAFTHVIRIYHEDQHQLVTNGVYR